MNYKKHQDFLIKLFDGDMAAVALCGAVPTILNNKCKEKYAEDTLWLALFDVPSNPFYQQHRAHLEPILKSLMLQWRVAGSVSEPSITLALMQSSAISFVLAVVFCLKGHQAVVDQGAEVAEFMFNELVNSCVDLTA